MSGDSGGLRYRPSRRIYQQQSTIETESMGLSWIPETTTVEMSPVTIVHGADVEEATEKSNHPPQEQGFLGVPSKQSVSTSGSVDTLIPSAPTSPSNLSAITLVGSTGSCEKCDVISIESTATFQYGKAPTSPLPERVVPKRPPRTIEQQAAATDTATVSKIQMPQPAKTAVEPKSVEVKPCTVKSPTASSSLSLTSTTVITTTMTSAVSTQKTSISPPSIGVTFDR